MFSTQKLLIVIFVQVMERRDKHLFKFYIPTSF